MQIMQKDKKMSQRFINTIKVYFGNHLKTATTLISCNIVKFAKNQAGYLHVFIQHLLFSVKFFFLSFQCKYLFPFSHFLFLCFDFLS